ncbi:MAG: LysR family transcriptional regulator [Pseudomonadota bacterium]
MNLSSRDLKAVIALVEERNFTRAARRVHLSQPAFSALVAALEDGLGARLFDRSTRNVVPTPEGRVFEEAARRMLVDFESMVGDFRDHAHKRKGRVAVAALPSLAAGWLPELLAAFRATHPGIELALFDSLSETCLALLRNRQVDFAFASTGTRSDDLEALPLCRDRFHLVCRKDHPLAGQATVRLKDLAGHPFVHMSRNTSVRQRLEAALHPRELHSIVEVEHLATVTGLVRAGLGISLVPALTLFHFGHPDLAVRPLAGKGIVREIFAVRRRNEQLSVAAQALWELALARRPLSPPPPAARPRASAR